MHIIMFNELENHLKKFDFQKDAFFDNLFEWTKHLDGEDLEGAEKMKNTFSSFFIKVKEHLSHIQYLISNTEIDKDIQSFTSFLELITPNSESIFSKHEELKEKLNLFDNEFKKFYRSNEGESDLKDLILVRDGMYISKFISSYYQVMLCYFESEILISNFIDKTKKFLLEKKA